ncbi:MAG: YciI family protein [Acidobacteriota bacterium]
MTESIHDEAGPQLREAISGLPRESPAPAAVEEGVVSALRARGVIRPNRGRSSRRAWLAAAAAGLLAAGFLIGRGFPPRRPPGSASPRFVLFLLRGAESVPQRPEEEAARVAEYRAWARGLAGAGRLVTGEKLEDRGERIGAPSSAAGPEGEEEIRGFFVISAFDFEDALAVARGCPHLRHGGRILVRPIAPV